MPPQNYKVTLHGCYFGYITGAIINNLAPILFIVFQKQYGLSLSQLGLLVTLNFGTQLVVDYLAIRVVDKIGTRASVIVAHLFAMLGLLMLGTFPLLFSQNLFPFLALAAMTYAVGGGLIEVLISPIVDSLPGEAKASSMALLHSFYCWGQVGAVALSTLYLYCFGSDRWYLLPLLWMIVPISNLPRLSKMPLVPMVSKQERMSFRELFTNKRVLLVLLLMTCSGASEMTMAQWSSLFAEEALGVQKVLGDLLGPCLFAILMGMGRTYFGIRGDHIDTKKALVATSALCVVCYLTASLSRVPLLSLLMCALTGFSICLMWPGVLSLAARAFPRGGTALFAFLALAGDLGCSIGPGIAGRVSDAVQQLPAIQQIPLFAGMEAAQIGLKCGLFVSVIFPITMIVGVLALSTKPTEQA